MPERPEARDTTQLGIGLVRSDSLSEIALTAGRNITNRSFKLSQWDHLALIQRSVPDIENKTLVVCVVVREPFVIFNQHSNWANLTTRGRQLMEQDLDNYSGVAIEVIKRLRSIFKFNIKIIRPADNQFGIYLPELKRWTGLMGVLHARQADIGVTALSITVSRAQAIDFTRAYYVETVAILVKTPEEVQNYLAIFEPFSLIVWIVLLATIVLLIALITIMTKLEDDQRKHEQMHKLAKFLEHGAGLLQPSIGDSHDQLKSVTASMKKDDWQYSGGRLGSISGMGARYGSDSGAVKDRQQQLEEQEHELQLRRWQQRSYSIKLNHRLSQLNRIQAKHEFGDSWLDRFYYAVTCVINILLIRDIKHPPHQTPIRILVCIWWLSSIVIVNIYLGILFGQLVVPRRLKSIETLEELVNQDQIDWCVTRGSAIYELFRQSEPSSIYGQLGLRMRNVSSADEGVQRVVESGWAFIRERSILTFKVAQEHNRLRACKMQFGREDFYSVGFGLGLVKRSKYLRPFNSALTLMIENGFVARWQSMHWPRRNQYTECKLQPTEGEPLTIKHFLSIYLVCSIIIGASALALVYQHIHEQVSVLARRQKSRIGTQ